MSAAPITSEVMTLRDEFALKALGPVLTFAIEQAEPETRVESMHRTVATVAYDLADCMMEARKT